MIIVYIYLILSFILDGILSNVFSMNSFFLPLLTVTSFVLIYPIFDKNVKKYLIFLAVTGLLYDICYGDVTLLNVILFSLTGLFIYYINKPLSDSYLAVLLKTLLVIIFYRVVSYIIYLVIMNQSFRFSLLLSSIYKSIILNIFYAIILFFIMYLANKRKRISRNY